MNRNQMHRDNSEQSPVPNRSRRSGRLTMAFCTGRSILSDRIYCTSCTVGSSLATSRPLGNPTPHLQAMPRMARSCTPASVVPRVMAFRLKVAERYRESGRHSFLFRHFVNYVRQPLGSMRAFPQETVSDAQLADIFAFLWSLLPSPKPGTRRIL